MFKVMIVDDMDIMLRELKRLRLWGEKTGFTIWEEARNGHEALEKLENASVDLVITDIKMPKVDGLELLKKIVEKDLCPCVVLLSDHSEFGFARQGLVLGAFDYIVKPVDEAVMSNLLSRVRDFLSDKRQQAERVKKLEEMLEEKIEVFFPSAETGEIIEYIRNADIKAMEATARMVDTLGGSLDHDVIKSSLLMKKALFEIINSVLENEEWAKRFIDPAPLMSVDFSACEDMETAKTILVGIVGKLFLHMDRLKCGRQENAMVNAVCNYVLENVDEEISIKSIAESLFMNKSYMSETFRQKTGSTLIEYITLVKMERAKRLIREGSLKTYEIAVKLGFKDIEYFSKLFKKFTGRSPTEFRKDDMEKTGN